jgi:hypothetical protein
MLERNACISASSVGFSFSACVAGEVGAFSSKAATVQFRAQKVSRNVVLAVTGDDIIEARISSKWKPQHSCALVMGKKRMKTGQRRNPQRENK